MNLFFAMTNEMAGLTIDTAIVTFRPKTLIMIWILGFERGSLTVDYYIRYQLTSPAIVTQQVAPKISVA